jgi:hypothetical protein
MICNRACRRCPAPCAGLTGIGDPPLTAEPFAVRELESGAWEGPATEVCSECVVEVLLCRGLVGFAASFAADLPARRAAFMAASQVPWGLGALNGEITDPAWRSKPTRYLIVTDDRMIPPPAQRQMAERASATTTEVAGSHAIYVSNPSAVAGLITQAAWSLPDATGVS